MREGLKLSKIRCDRVFVLGAYKPNGGAYMAYHVGRILHQHFGVESLCVTMGDETIENGVREYDLKMPKIAIHDLAGTVTDDDILLVNPSFSKLLLGWRLRGIKICYVQGFSTYDLLDCRFDYYVAVS